MRHYTILILLILAFTSLAQDKILTIKGDTILAKVQNIEDGKISYLKDNKPFTMEKSALHKIIWRNNLDFVINQMLEDSLKLNFIKKKSGIEKMNIQNIDGGEFFKNAPILKCRNIMGFLIYKKDNIKCSETEISKTIYKYDKIAYLDFAEGRRISDKSQGAGMFFFPIISGSMDLKGAYLKKSAVRQYNLKIANQRKNIH